MATNADAAGDPGLVNREAQSGGWLMKIRLSDKSELDGLMDEAAYRKTIA
jgi:glycine cleavage system H protein